MSKSRTFTVSLYQYIDDPLREGHKSDMAYATRKSNKPGRAWATIR